MRPAVLVALAALLAGAETERLPLSGSGPATAVPWEFQVSAGSRAGVWSTLPVPSNWELHGFGSYSYGQQKDRPQPPGESGRYRHRFSVPAAWQGRRVRLVFGGASTDTTVLLNGQSAGPTHRGGFTEFAYEVAELLRYGTQDGGGGDDANRLEVQVDEQSADASVEAAERQGDYWNFGGIFRPVWLEARPAAGFDHLAVDARADGRVTVRARLAGARAGDELRLVVRPAGAAVATADPAPPADALPVAALALGAAVDQVEVAALVPGVAPWHPEQPRLYELEVALARGGGVLHRERLRIGFRTIEVRSGDGIYLNGRRLLLRGFNRHSTWPDSGRALDAARSRADAALIRELGGNAVRLAHYPGDRHFLDACDELGVLAVVELPGWHKPYSTAAGRPLLRELVERDVNHPCVALWANGHEEGWNSELDDDFAVHDPQRRAVLHPWAAFRGIDCKHYPTYAAAQERCAGTQLFLPTECQHALYDGGGAAGLADLWELIRTSRVGAGLFIWNLADEGVRRSDQGGAIDVAGQLAPDGVTGPYREREGSCPAIAAIWSPVVVAEPRLDAGFAGALAVENRFAITDLAATAWRWELWRFPAPGAAGAGHSVVASGSAAAPAVPPGGRGSLRLDLPGDWRRADALMLRVADAGGRALRTWSWPITPAGDLARAVVGARLVPGVGASLVEEGGDLVARTGGHVLRVSTATGLLSALERDGRRCALHAGPALVGAIGAVTRASGRVEGAVAIIDGPGAGDLRHLRWSLFPSGWVQLDLDWTASGVQPFLGCAFRLPTAAVRGLRWLGQGPYRVWKNRQEGGLYDVWQLPWQPTATGMAWTYPESCGVFAGARWARIATADGPLTLVIPDDAIALRLGTPAQPRQALKARAELPPGDLALLTAIPPMGSKFHSPDQLGPSGQGTAVDGRHRLTVWMRFGE